jgi:hypothetical protein
MNSSDNTPQEGVKGTKRSTTELSDGHAAENSFAPRTPHGQGYARSFTKRGIPKSILRAAKCIPKGIRWGYFWRGNDRMSSDERSHEPVGKPADTTGETSTHQPDVTPPTSHMERANGSAECANDAAKKHIDRELRFGDFWTDTMEPWLREIMRYGDNRVILLVDDAQWAGMEKRAREKSHTKFVYYGGDRMILPFGGSIDVVRRSDYDEGIAQAAEAGQI